MGGTYTYVHYIFIPLPKIINNKSMKDLKIGDKVNFKEPGSDQEYVGRVVVYKGELKILDGGTVLNIEDVNIEDN